MLHVTRAGPDIPNNAGSLGSFFSSSFEGLQGDDVASPSLANVACYRRYFAWWAKYNCKGTIFRLLFWFAHALLDVLSAALDSGLALSVITIFFTYVPPPRAVT